MSIRARITVLFAIRDFGHLHRTSKYKKTYFITFFDESDILVSWFECSCYHMVTVVHTACK